MCRNHRLQVKGKFETEVPCHVLACVLPTELPGKKQHGYMISRTDYFAGYRKSLTIVTSTWSDGSRGPLGICFPEQFIDADTVAEFNRKHRGRAFAFSSQQASHFMTGPTFVKMMHGMLTDATALQRKKHRLSHHIRGLLLLDAWTGFHSFRDGLDLARSNWACAMNMQLGDLQCGGWSANGQPCDQFHHLVRSRLEVLDCDDVGCVSDMRARKKFDEHPVAANGQVKRPRADSSTILERTVKAWETVPGTQFFTHAYFGW